MNGRTSEVNEDIERVSAFTIEGNTRHESRSGG
jgi:hypothetical protein